MQAATDTTIPQSTREQIEALLSAIEAERKLRVLFACESGSRAWGFASTDSDYDIRFIFARPVETYLQLRPPSDAFDVQAPGDLDAAGWDVRKTAELMRRSNPPLMEWIDSPIIYRAATGVHDRLRQLRALYFDAKKSAYHYLSMANTVWKTHLLDQPTPVRKKYLYALRPLACVRYVHLHQSQPPTEFESVLDKIDWPDEAMRAVRTLVEHKKASRELGAAPADAILTRYILEWLAAGETIAAALPVNDQPTDKLDRFVFDSVLKSA